MSGPPPRGDENRQQGMLITTVVVTVLPNIVVFLRMLIRFRIVKCVGWDDWTIVAAAIGISISTGLVIVQLHYGFGRHKYYLTQWQFIESQKYSYGEWMQTFATLMFTKISICFLLLRITIHQAFIRPIQALAASLIVSNIVLTIVWIAQCRPLAEAWNTTIQGTCFSKGQLQRIIIVQAIISIISDCILAAFPILILRRVQISLRIKVGLCSLMSLGVITGGICLARTILNWQNINEDPTWLSVDNWYLRSWEVCIGIVAACIPTLHPGYLYLASRMQQTSSSAFKILSHHSSKVPLHHQGGNHEINGNADNSTTNNVNGTISSHPNENSRDSSTRSEVSMTLPLQTFGIMKTTRIDITNQEQGDYSADNAELSFEREGELKPGESHKKTRAIDDIV